MAELLFDNQRQGRKARLVVLGTIVWSLGWLYWSTVITQTFGLSAGDGGALRPAGQRYTIAILMVAVAFAPLIGMLVYGRVYLTRILREGDRLELTSLGFLLPFRFRVALSDLAGATTYQSETTGPSTPWITLRVKGRKLPFVIDLQAEHVNKDAILGLAERRATKD